MSLQDDAKRINRKLNALGRQQIPRAAVKAINKVARSIGSRAMKAVAKDVGVPVKTVRGRMQIARAKGNLPTATIRVIRSHMPAIRLLENRSNKIWVGRGGIVVGKYAIHRGFRQRLKNGRWHILQRQGKERYPIDVVKIPVGNLITNEFKKQTRDYPAEVRAELVKELRIG
ncbi:MAG: phage tail protein [[Actinobacillus] rossii]|uniref:Phage tail component n=1 Tax=[Actinobacillus] rossii TaxID=123820 RepID=A0A380U019_9PAST|nr:phage tail protein [[Actinobacillus] rossii]MDD7426085.1 phage tail protein [[Actinobacillus] rossii]MDY3122843.1 phage tail protein [[Actinobacillus] rossii]MDY4505481.1 phage tail protein [[Actinobacillus] rossii]SUT93642.1 phage tail component [[Actinobacillus] rossii]